MCLKVLLTIIITAIMLGAITATLMHLWGIFEFVLCYKLVAIELFSMFIVVLILMMFSVYN